MGTYAVYLKAETPESINRAVDLLEENYSERQRYRVAEDFFLISGPYMSGEITKALVLDEDPDLNLVVLRLNGSFSGRSWPSLWEWLKSADRESL